MSENNIFYDPTVTSPKVESTRDIGKSNEKEIDDSQFLKAPKFNIKRFSAVEEKIKKG